MHCKQRLGECGNTSIEMKIKKIRAKWGSRKSKSERTKKKKLLSKHLNLHKQIHIHISELLFCHVTKYMADDISE